MDIVSEIYFYYGKMTIPIISYGKIICSYFIKSIKKFQITIKYSSSPSTILIFQKKVHRDTIPRRRSI